MAAAGRPAQGLGSCRGRRTVIGRIAPVGLPVSLSRANGTVPALVVVFVSTEEGATSVLLLPLVAVGLTRMGNGEHCPTDMESERWSPAPKTLLETDCMSGDGQPLGCLVSALWARRRQSVYHYLVSLPVPGLALSSYCIRGPTGPKVPEALVGSNSSQSTQAPNYLGTYPDLRGYVATSL